VGLREVNQQAGRVYREVESTGVPVTVTDRGRPIAQIVPIRDDESWYERMVREGKHYAKRFTPKHIMRELRTIYENVLLTHD